MLPGTTTELNVPGFAFFTLGTVYIDRGQFRGSPPSAAAPPTRWRLHGSRRSRCGALSCVSTVTWTSSAATPSVRRGIARLQDTALLPVVIWVRH